jgi:hypothetical protein
MYGSNLLIMKKTTLTNPLPWSHVTDARDRKMSSVIDANGILVCGSRICQQSNPRNKANHALIVKAVNRFGALQDVAHLAQVMSKPHKAGTCLKMDEALTTLASVAATDFTTVA